MHFTRHCFYLLFSILFILSILFESALSINAMINYNNRKFRAVQNSSSGEVSSETLFHYYQEADLVWGEYSGGEIVRGSLIAKCDARGNLDMRYQHLNRRGELMTGECRSTPGILPDGRLWLHEKWQWTCGDRSKGESIIEEAAD